jgi:CBS domain-containing protein
MTHAYVKDIMTANVVAVTTDAPYRNMAAMFRLHRVSGFPVADADGKVVGVVSETDLLARTSSPARRPV